MTVIIGKNGRGSCEPAALWVRTLSDRKLLSEPAARKKKTPLCNHGQWQANCAGTKEVWNDLRVYSEGYIPAFQPYDVCGQHHLCTVVIAEDHNKSVTIGRGHAEMMLLVTTKKPNNYHQ